MAGNELISNDAVLGEELQDPEFRAEWERTALPRWLAIEVSRYRADHNQTQTELATMLGMKQPAIARLESGETMPTLQTLARLATGLGLELVIDIRPTGVEPKLPKRVVRRSTAVHYEGAELLLATT